MKLLSVELDNQYRQHFLWIQNDIFLKNLKNIAKKYLDAFLLGNSTLSCLGRRFDDSIPVVCSTFFEETCPIWVETQPPQVLFTNDGSSANMKKIGRLDAFFPARCVSSRLCRVGRQTPGARNCGHRTSAYWAKQNWGTSPTSSEVCKNTNRYLLYRYKNGGLKHFCLSGKTFVYFLPSFPQQKSCFFFNRQTCNTMKPPEQWSKP